MTENKQLLIWGGVGLLALGLLYLMSRQGGASTGPSDNGYQAAAPTPLASQGATYTPATFVFNDGPVGSANLTNPGSLVLFPFLVDNTQPFVGNTPGSVNQGVPVAGMTSADGGTSGGCGCNTPACSQQGQATTTAYGTLGAWAQVMAPIMNKMVSALPNGFYGAQDPNAKTIFQGEDAVFKQQQANLPGNQMFATSDAISSWFGTA